jgi:hypothetical protein
MKLSEFPGCCGARILFGLAECSHGHGCELCGRPTTKIAREYVDISGERAVFATVSEGQENGFDVLLSCGFIPIWQWENPITKRMNYLLVNKGGKVSFPSWKWLKVYHGREKQKKKAAQITDGELFLFLFLGSAIGWLIWTGIGRLIAVLL